MRKMQRAKVATERNVWVILYVLMHVIKVCRREICDGGSTWACETPRKRCRIGAQKVIGDYENNKQGFMISLNTNTPAEFRFQCRTIINSGKVNEKVDTHKGSQHPVVLHHPQQIQCWVG